MVNRWDSNCSISSTDFEILFVGGVFELSQYLYIVITRYKKIAFFQLF